MVDLPPVPAPRRPRGFWIFGWDDLIIIGIALLITAAVVTAAYVTLQSQIDPDRFDIDRFDLNDRYRTDAVKLSEGQTTESRPGAFYSSPSTTTKLASLLTPVIPIDGSALFMDGDNPLANLRRSTCYWTPSGTEFEMAWEVLGKGVALKTDGGSSACDRDTVIGACGPFTNPVTRNPFQCMSSMPPGDLTAGPPWRDSFSGLMSGFRLHLCPAETVANPFNDCRVAPPSTLCTAKPIFDACGGPDTHVHNYPFCLERCTTKPGLGDTTIHFEVAGLRGPQGAAPLATPFRPVVKAVGKDGSTLVNGNFARGMTRSLIARDHLPPLPQTEAEWHWNVDTAETSGVDALPTESWRENFSPFLTLERVRFFVLDANAPDGSGRRYLRPLWIRLVDLDRREADGRWTHRDDTGAIDRDKIARPIFEPSDCFLAGPAEPPTTNKADLSNCRLLPFVTPAYYPGCTDSAGKRICNRGYLRWVVRFIARDGENTDNPLALAPDTEIPMIEFTWPNRTGQGLRADLPGGARLAPSMFDFTPTQVDYLVPATPSEPTRVVPVAPDLLTAANTRVRIGDSVTAFLRLELAAGAIDLVEVGVNGPHAGDFPAPRVVGATVGARLPPGASVPVEVTFRPTATGRRTAEVYVVLRMVGGDRRLSAIVTGSAGEPALALSVAGQDVTSITLSSGLLEPGRVAADLVNPGPVDTFVLSMRVEGADAAAFVVVRRSGAPLNLPSLVPHSRGGALPFEVRMNPNVSLWRAHAAELVVVANAGTYRFALRSTPIGFARVMTALGLGASDRPVVSQRGP